MEDYNAQTTNPSPFEEPLTISQMGIEYLSETRKWTLFLSIMGFIGIGLIVIVAAFAGTILSSASNGEFDEMTGGMGAWVSLLYLLIGLLYFFPTWYLFNFSRKMKLALDTKNNTELLYAFRNQKSFFKFLGVFTIITIGFYVLFAAFAILGALA